MGINGRNQDAVTPGSVRESAEGKSGLAVNTPNT
jgi:hypothetical protein